MELLRTLSEQTADFCRLVFDANLSCVIFSHMVLLSYQKKYNNTLSET